MWNLKKRKINVLPKYVDSFNDLLKFFSFEMDTGEN